MTDTRQASSGTFEPRSRIQRLLRPLAVGFHVVLKYTGLGKPFPEPKKVALRKNRWKAFSAGKIHFIPVATTIVLMGFNLTGYYIGSELTGPTGYDDQKFILLQFAAKLHELAIVASLTAILFSLIRHELTTAGGLPFGALFAGYQFKDISFLLSLEFLGAARAKLERSYRRWAIIVFVIVCTFLSISAGPSSATLMRPRLDNWPAGGSDFWINIREAELFSTNVTMSQVAPSCAVDDGDANCPYGDWQTIAQDYMSYWHIVRLSDDPLPYAVNMPGNKSVRILMATTRSPLLWVQLPFTVATVPSLALAYGLAELGRLWKFASADQRGHGWRFWSRKDVIFSVPTQQPVVHARCLSLNASTYDDYVLQKYQLTNQSVPFYDLHDMDTFKAEGEFAVSAVSFPSRPGILDTVNSSSTPDILWKNVTHEEGEPALGTILTVPSNSQYGARVYLCTVDARMAPAVLRSRLSLTTLLIDGFTQDGQTQDKYDHWSMQQFGTYGSGNTWPRFSIDPDWAHTFLNPVIASDNSTSFGSIMSTAGLWNTSQVLDVADAGYAIESLLATTIVNGLSRRDNMGDFAGSLAGNPQGLNRQTTTSSQDSSLNCAEWCKQLMPSNGRPMGYGGNAFDVSNLELQNSTKFTVQVEAQGYAYSSRGTAAIFSVFVLLLHSSIAVGYFLYTWLYSKESSDSWGRISELVALAMRSTPSGILENTGAGIDCIDVYQKETKVVERNGRLQLAIEVPSGRYEMVKANENYA